jgi:hypothetical protein
MEFVEGAPIAFVDSSNVRRQSSNFTVIAMLATVGFSLIAHGLVRYRAIPTAKCGISILPRAKPVLSPLGRTLRLLEMISAVELLLRNVQRDYSYDSRRQIRGTFLYARQVREGISSPASTLMRRDALSSKS